MEITASEIGIGQRLVLKGYKSYRIIDKIKETVKTITFSVKYYTLNVRCLGDFIEKEVTFRKSSIVETREDEIGTKFNQLHRIKPKRLKECLERGLELYQVKAKQTYSWGDDGLEIGDYMFAHFNGVNYETERILDKGCVNAIPPSKNSDKPQISGWSNALGGFEDYYEKVDMNILINASEKMRVADVIGNAYEKA